MWNVKVQWHDGYDKDFTAEFVRTERSQWHLAHEGDIVLVPVRDVRFVRLTKKDPEKDREKK